MISFNRPTFIGPELDYVRQAIEGGMISGNGPFTKKCHKFLKERYGFKHCLLTPSGTAALEMCALLAGIQPGDEVILPSFTFSSTANAFALRGAKLKFVDSLSEHPNMDCSLVEELITNKTKAICAVHYGGAPCDMELLLDICDRHKLILIEDAAHAIESTWKGRQLGSIGSVGAFSFHETKNITCGEGGLLIVNDPKLIERSEIIWEKGTNRRKFFSGEVDKYQWVDIGSSYVLSDLNAAYLYGQLENIDLIQNHRLKIWNSYCDQLNSIFQQYDILTSNISFFEKPNGHNFYFVLPKTFDRNLMISKFKAGGINIVFHYQTLHDSPFYRDQQDNRSLPNSINFSDHLLRLPLHCSINEKDVRYLATLLKKVLNS